MHYAQPVGVQGGHALTQSLAYLVILCFEKRRPEQKCCCSPKVKHFSPKSLV